VTRHLRNGLLAVALLLAALLAYAHFRSHPQDLPWTKLDLGEPPGLFTGRKLAGLTEDFATCRALLDRAGVRYEAMPPIAEGETCGYDDGVRFQNGGSRRIRLESERVITSCPVAAALAMWEWNYVQTAAHRHLGQRVTAIEHLGSYSCRRIVGREGGGWSQHAQANAIDVAAFRLADGTRVTVKGDWLGGGAKAAFLHEVRDGACHLFATTLSPDYNAAHEDHLHLDQAPRGKFGWRGCR
jgi:hypothetical protein